jgi:hypothetical protein
MTALAALNVRMSFHRRISMVVDFALAGALFWLQDGLRGPAFWVGLLPILTGSIYFEFPGSLISSFLFSGFMIYEDTRWEGGFGIALAAIALTIMLGALFGFLGQRLMDPCPQEPQMVDGYRGEKTSHSKRADARHL